MSVFYELGRKTEFGLDSDEMANTLTFCSWKCVIAKFILMDKDGIDFIDLPFVQMGKVGNDISQHGAGLTDLLKKVFA